MQKPVNNEINYAKKYHEETKHSEISIQRSRHYLDWNNKPLLFKVYSTMPLISLPKDFPQPTEGALTCIGKTKTTKGKTVALDIKSLAEILFFAVALQEYQARLWHLLYACRICYRCTLSYRAVCNLSRYTWFEGWYLPLLSWRFYSYRATKW